MMFTKLLEQTMKIDEKIYSVTLKERLIRLFEQTTTGLVEPAVMQFNSCSNKLSKEQKSKVREMSWQQIAEALYQLLDDIDTYSDVCRENLQAFQDLVLKKQQEKNNYLYSPEGYKLKRVSEGMADYARRELELAGMFDSEVEGSEAAGSWNKLVAESVIALLEIFGSQGHSGASAEMARELFLKLSNFEALTELTSNPEEWNDVSEMSGGHPMWQNIRAPASFSTDGGKTYYNLDILAEKDDDTHPDTKDLKLFTSMVFVKEAHQPKGKKSG